MLSFDIPTVRTVGKIHTVQYSISRSCATRAVFVQNLQFRTLIVALVKDVVRKNTIYHTPRPVVIIIMVVHTSVCTA